MSAGVNECMKYMSEWNNTHEWMKYKPEILKANWKKNSSQQLH